MEMTLNYGFSELSFDEMNLVDGGVDWYSIGMGLSMTAGGLIGGAIGSCVGPAGTVAGVKVGTVAGTIIGGAASVLRCLFGGSCYGAI